jgi:hypothetical protein
VREIREGIDDTGVKAAFIKCAVEVSPTSDGRPSIEKLARPTGRASTCSATYRPGPAGAQFGPAGFFWQGVSCAIQPWTSASVCATRATVSCTQPS